MGRPAGGGVAERILDSKIGAGSAFSLGSAGSFALSTPLGSPAWRFYCWVPKRWSVRNGGQKTGSRQFGRDATTRRRSNRAISESSPAGAGSASRTPAPLFGSKLEAAAAAQRLVTGSAAVLRRMCRRVQHRGPT